VVDLDLERNAVVVGNRSEAYSMGCVVEDLNVIASDRLRGTVSGTCMVRYRGKEVGATMEPLDHKKDQQGRADSSTGSSTAAMQQLHGQPERLYSAVIRFDTPQFAVTPGQSAVFYQDELVYGGGVIAGRLEGA
jgi:tRNA-specific 2-thiouridylase